MTTTGYSLTQHDQALLSSTVTGLTGEPAHVGETRMAFLATLTPVVSAEIVYMLHGDGHVDSMAAQCPVCNDDLRMLHSSDPFSFGNDIELTTEVWKRILATPRPSHVRRGLARLKAAFSLDSCSNCNFARREDLIRAHGAAPKA